METQVLGNNQLNRAPMIRRNSRSGLPLFTIRKLPNDNRGDQGRAEFMGVAKKQLALYSIAASSCPARQ